MWLLPYRFLPQVCRVLIVKYVVSLTLLYPLTLIHIILIDFLLFLSSSPLRPKMAKPPTLNLNFNKPYCISKKVNYKKILLYATYTL